MEIGLSAYRKARNGDLAEEIEFALPAGATPLGAGVRLAEPATVAVRVVGGPSVVRVEVSSRLQLAQPCDRCLEDVRLHVPVDYVEEWALQGGAARAFLEGRAAAEMGPESLDTDDALVVRRTVTTDAGTLDDGFWQNVLLEMPSKVLCAEECQGLCPHCGANRNRTTCACRETDGDPRLGALAKFRQAPDKR